MKPELLSAVGAAALIAFMSASLAGCSNKSSTAGVQLAKQEAKCSGECTGTCTKPCLNSDGTKKCAPDCKKPCCAKDAKTTAAVNSKCPISGMPANPGTTVLAGGKTVAFCCPGCIGKWEKLTQTERMEKLAAAR